MAIREISLTYWMQPNLLNMPSSERESVAPEEHITWLKQWVWQSLEVPYVNCDVPTEETSSNFNADLY